MVTIKIQTKGAPVFVNEISLHSAYERISKLNFITKCKKRLWV